MNMHQVVGTARDIVGRVQEKLGKLVGSMDQQVRGIEKQVIGKAQKRIGEIRGQMDAAPSAPVARPAFGRARSRPG